MLMQINLLLFLKYGKNYIEEIYAREFFDKGWNLIGIKIKKDLNFKVFKNLLNQAKNMSNCPHDKVIKVVVNSRLFGLNFRFLINRTT